MEFDKEGKMIHNNLEFEEKAKKKEHRNSEVFHEDKEKNKNKEGFPHLCSKCCHDKAEVLDLGVWFGDEAMVIRYKCIKCGYAEQDKGSNS